MRRLVLLLSLALAGCGAHPQTPLQPASGEAGALNGLLGLMVAVSAVVYALVLGFLALALWRSRRRVVAGAGEKGLNAALWVWGAVIVVGVSAFAVASFWTDRGLALARPIDAVEVRVTGHQWWWRVQYRDPGTGGWIETANTLHLPAGRTARIELQAADVIHSFWIPNLSGKLDMIPGRTNILYVTPQRTGAFRGQCGEFCGLQHAQMALDVTVQSQADFAAWRARQASSAAAPSGALERQGLAVLETKSCGLCHTVRGTRAAGRAGPDLTHVGARRTIAAGALPAGRGPLAGWIAQPQAVKPGTLMPPGGLTPDETNAVAAYLEGLS